VLNWAEVVRTLHHIKTSHNTNNKKQGPRMRGPYHKVLVELISHPPTP
jgi:hypothetical protein